MAHQAVKTAAKTEDRTRKPAGKARSSAGAASRETRCRLVDAFWTFWPAFQRWADAKTEDERLTPQRIRILALLQEKGPQIMSGLRDELGVSATNITALVDALERDGLVRRKAHPDDRRATIVEVTDKVGGCRQTTTSCMAYAERVGELFNTLSEAEARQLLETVSKLKARLSESGN